MSASETETGPSHPSLVESNSTFAACARQDVATAMREEYKDGFGWRRPTQVPIVYSDKYNVTLFGLEKLHPFDAAKFKKVVSGLVAANLLARGQLVEPRLPSEEVLRDVHTEAYLAQLASSPLAVARVTELAPLALLPNWLVQWRVVTPMKMHVGGTMLAAALAVENGWSINIGGGLHHAYFEAGGGWCAFDDIMLAIRKLRAASGGRIRKAMIVDTDVHQGNGHERDKLHFKDADTHIMDVYNYMLYPGDGVAKAGIDTAVELPSGTPDEVYLAALQKGLSQAFAACQPDIVLYNAGTDILEGDPLGRMQVSARGVVQRDEMVWTAAQRAGAPICMVLSGGYTRRTHEVIASSIANLAAKFRLLGSKL